MIVALGIDGAVVRDADDSARLHLETDLDADALRAALKMTGTGAPADAGHVWLDLAVLRSRAALLAATPDWSQRWSGMVDHARGRGWLSEDGMSVRVHVERASAR